MTIEQLIIECLNECTQGGAQAELRNGKVVLVFPVERDGVRVEAEHVLTISAREAGVCGPDPLDAPALRAAGERFRQAGANIAGGRR